MTNCLSVATWNVNSINAHLDQVLNWIKNNNPDILLLQETKCEDVNFPYSAFEKYNISHYGQKTYNGVDILSKFPFEDVLTSFSNNPCPEQSRFIEANISTPLGLIKVISVYVPNGEEVGSDKFKVKLVFLKQLNAYLNNIESDIYTIIGGDFNIAPFDIDVYSPEKMFGKLHFSYKEIASMRSILNSNFIDTYRLKNPVSQEFSWWDYRSKSFDRNAGLRIDFLLANPKLSNHLISSAIDSKIRAYPKCSDHAPIISRFQH